MEPEVFSPHPSPETGPIEKGQEKPVALPTSERFAPNRVEQSKKEESREMLPSPVSSSGGDPAFVAPPLPVLPPAQSNATQVPSGSPSANGNPLVAADDDLIEKEWVDRAKKIILTTKTDPYLQEKEISKLQADYLHKRYGKEVKISTD